MTAKEVAAELCDYLAFRAHREGKRMELDRKFFLHYLRRGVGRFFGITVGPCGIEGDEQNPSALEAWRRRQ